MSETMYDKLFKFSQEKANQEFINAITNARKVMKRCNMDNNGNCDPSVMIAVAQIITKLQLEIASDAISRLETNNKMEINIENE